MPSRNQSGKPSHAFQNPNKKRKKSGKKLINALDRYVLIMKKSKKAGFENRAVATMKKCHLRLKKYSVTPAMIETHMAKRGM